MTDGNVNRIRRRVFVSGSVLRPVAIWVLAVAVLTLGIAGVFIRGTTPGDQISSSGVNDNNNEDTDLVLRIRGLPYSSNAHGFAGGVAMSEAQLLIRTRLVNGEDGSSQLLIDARLVSSDGENIWSKTTVSENKGVGSVQEEISRTLTEAMRHVGIDDDKISI